jgi:hypothetical protein
VTLLELARQVAEARAAQREYFRTRSTAALDQSRSLERRLDKTIERILDRTPSLFPIDDTETP